AVRVVGMIMCEEYAVDGADLGVQKLLAKIGWCIHEDPCPPAARNALDECCAAAPAILRVGGITGAPVVAEPRHAAGRPRAEKRQLTAHAVELSAASLPASVRGTLA